MEKNIEQNTVSIFLKEKFENVLPYPLLTIYQALGLNESEAQTAYANTLVVRCSHAFIEAVHIVYQANWPTEALSLIEQLSAVLETYEMTISQLDNLLIVNLLPSDTSALTREDAGYLYEALGPLFTNQLGSEYIQVSWTDGTHKRIRTWSPAVMQMTSYCLEEYQRWFTNKKEEISPQFAEIKDEIGDYLKNSYAGINPRMDGFVQWFLANKLGSATIEFELQPIPSLSEDDYTIVGFKADLPNNKQRSIIVERHLHEYCQWKLQQQEKIKESVSKFTLSNDFDDNKPNNVCHKSQAQNRLTQKQLALYYFYMQQTGYMPHFVAGKLQEEYKNAANKYKMSPIPFQKEFNKFQRFNERVTTQNAENIKYVITLLKEYPKAKRMAEDELRTAETRDPLM